MAVKMYMYTTGRADPCMTRSQSDACGDTYHAHRAVNLVLAAVPAQTFPVQAPPPFLLRYDTYKQSVAYGEGRSWKLPDSPAVFGAGLWGAAGDELGLRGALHAGGAALNRGICAAPFTQ